MSTLISRVAVKLVFVALSGDWDKKVTRERVRYATSDAKGSTACLILAAMWPSGVESKDSWG
jgi:hypothetical protein